MEKCQYNNHNKNELTLTFEKKERQTHLKKKTKEDFYVMLSVSWQLFDTIRYNKNWEQDDYNYAVVDGFCWNETVHIIDRFMSIVYWLIGNTIVSFSVLLLRIYKSHTYTHAHSSKWSNGTVI